MNVLQENIQRIIRIIKDMRDSSHIIFGTYMLTEYDYYSYIAIVAREITNYNKNINHRFPYSSDNIW